ncbi:MAG: hypothetical protein HQK50_18910, partial [Oligoflexia bacterium]|nr:hypothetical protein [Oligoflexia bacterium]
MKNYVLLQNGYTYGYFFYADKCLMIKIITIIISLQLIFSPLSDLAFAQTSPPSPPAPLSPAACNLSDENAKCSPLDGCQQEGGGYDKNCLQSIFNTGMAGNAALGGGQGNAAGDDWAPIAMYISDMLSDLIFLIQGLMTVAIHNKGVQDMATTASKPTRICPGFPPMVSDILTQISGTAMFLVDFFLYLSFKLAIMNLTKPAVKEISDASDSKKSTP